MGLIQFQGTYIRLWDLLMQFVKLIAQIHNIVGANPIEPWVFDSHSAG